MQMTNLERSRGRLMRDEGGHPPVVTPRVDPIVPPVDPVVPPVDPVVPPVVPPVGEKPVEAKPEYVPLTPESLKFPTAEEGFVMDDAVRDEFLGVVNNQELTGDARAQALVDLYLKTAKQASDQGSAAWETTQTQWQDQAKADTEIGGDKLPAVLATVSKAIERFGSPELREAMDLTGAGNHPAVIKFLYNMAKQFNEGTPVSGAAAGGAISLAERMFPSMAKG